jgi:hypothetical protein
MYSLGTKWSMMPPRIKPRSSAHQILLRYIKRLSLKGFRIGKIYDKAQSKNKARIIRKVLFLKNFIFNLTTSEETFGHLGGVFL